MKNEKIIIDDKDLDRMPVGASIFWIFFGALFIWGLIVIGVML